MLIGMGQVYKAIVFSSIVMIFLCGQGLCDWSNIQNGIITIPAHVYRVQLNYNQQITLKLSWDDNINADLDIYIFEIGRNLLNLYAVTYGCVSNRTDGQMCQGTISSGVYFVRVYAQNMGNSTYLQYDIQIDLATTNANYSGIFHKNYRSNFATLTDIIQQNSISLRYETNSSITNRVTLIASQNYINLINYEIKQVTIPGNFTQHSWIIVVQDSQTSAYSLTTIYYNLSYFTCPYNHARIQNTYQCINNNYTNNTINNGNTPNTNTALIIGSVVGAVILIAAVAMAIFLYKRYKRTHQYQHQGQPPQPHPQLYQYNNNNHNHNNGNGDGNGNGNDSLMDLVGRQDVCCICLSEKCDKALKCKHTFHKRCIQEWFKKNANCPMCRHSISAIQP